MLPSQSRGRRPVGVDIDPLRSLLACCLLLGPWAAAEDLEEVRVVAQRNLLGQGLGDSLAVARIAAEDPISPGRSVADWIASLPGVTLNGQGGLLQSYSVRGFSRWRIRTEVDGVPIITDRRAGNSVSFLPPDLLAGATVQRGPGSTLYGSGAMGGVVSLQSLAATGTSARLSGQSGDNASALTVASGRAERYSAALSYRRAGRAEDAEGEALNSGYEQVAAAIRGQAEWRGLQLSGSWLPSLGTDIGKSSALYPGEQVSDYPEDRHSVAQLTLRSDAGWLLQAYHHYQDWESRTVRVGSRRNETRYRADTVGGLFYQGLDYLGGTGRWGLEWTGRRNVDIRDREYSNDGELVLSQQLIEGEQDNVAAFIDHQWLGAAFDVGGGLRFDYVSQDEGDRRRSDQQLVASLRGEWRPAPDWRLQAEAGTGFRFPTLSELYFNGVTPRGDTLGNPRLDPEHNRALQLSLGWDHGGWSVDASAYHNTLRDYIERYPVDAELRSYRNLDRAEISGFELNVGWRPDSRWSHALGYQWQQGEDDEGNTLADLNPPGVHYRLTREGDAWQLRSVLHYRASRDDAGAGELPLASALIWNASAARRLGAGWRLELYAVNLLDEHYRGAADEDAAYQPGRTLGLRLAWNER